jgi:putative copper export protein/mono/diheme cytochrome c family protein
MSGLATTMALLRGLHLAAALSLLGTAGFIAWMLPAAMLAPTGPQLSLRRALNRLCRASGVIAVVAGAGWLILEAVAMAGADTVPEALHALPLVALQTHFGTVMLARLGLLLVATAFFRPDTRRGTYLILLLTAAALSLQGLIGHAGATAGALGDSLVASEAFHLLAAGLWLGALLPLWLGVQALPPAQAAAVCERFTPLGIACVLVLAGTGLFQGLDFIGSLPGLLGTPYGHFALLKIALFLSALVLALLNRLWLTDRLSAGATAARRHLLLSVCLETGLGLAIVGAAAFMASSTPAVHATPVWPFPWRFNLERVTEDPAIRREVIISAALIGTAALGLLGAIIRKRFRLPAALVLAILVLLRGPSLGLLTVAAWPTSFQASPTGFSAAAIARGEALYGPYCASCHGAGGQGNGPGATALPVKPADLTMPHLWAHRDGDLFWWLSQGMKDPNGEVVMPGYARSLPAADRWALIDYIRARNAGLAGRPEPLLGRPVPAPGFAVTCNGLNAASLADLHGHLVCVTADAPPPPPAGVAMVGVTLQADARPAAGGCAAAEPAARDAYAVLADLPPARLDGTEFLVDPNGWLRAVLRPDSGGQRQRNEMIAVILDPAGSSLNSASGGAHEHHH